MGGTYFAWVWLTTINTLQGGGKAMAIEYITTLESVAAPSPNRKSSFVYDIRIKSTRAYSRASIFGVSRDYFVWSLVSPRGLNGT